MTNNHKGFSFALLIMAVVALSGIAAQGALASPLTIEGGGAKTWFTGDQDGGKHKFTSTSAVECNNAVFSAESSEGSSVNELTVGVTYSGCTAFGFASTDIKMNGCAFTYTTPTSVETGVVKWDPSQVHLTCPAGQKIEVTPTTFGFSVCTQSVAEQTPTGGSVMGRNVAGTSPMEGTLEAKLTGIHYTGTGGACGSSGTNAEYVGNSRVRCYSNETHAIQVGCTFS